MIKKLMYLLGMKLYIYFHSPSDFKLSFFKPAEKNLCKYLAVIEIKKGRPNKWLKIKPYLVDKLIIVVV